MKDIYVFWQNWPYWAKIGLIFVSIYLIFAILFAVSFLTQNYSDSSLNIISIYVQSPGLQTAFILGLNRGSLIFGSKQEIVWNLFIIIIINSLIYFAVGSVITLIFKKIKNKIKIH